MEVMHRSVTAANRQLVARRDCRGQVSLRPTHSLDHVEARRVNDVVLRTHEKIGVVLGQPQKAQQHSGREGDRELGREVATPTFDHAVHELGCELVDDRGEPAHLSR